MTKKKALGRGLSALFEQSDSDLKKSTPEKDAEESVKAPIKTAPVKANQSSTAKNEKNNLVGSAGQINEPNESSETVTPYQLLKLESIKANINQPRSFFDEEKLKELAQSIKEFGIIEPIIVNLVNQKPDGQHYEVIAGERRLRAAKLAGLEEIPAIIKNVENDDLLEVMLIENLQREDLTVLEEAESFATIIEKKNLTQDQLAERIGKSRSHITNTIRILKAPLAVKTLLAQNQLSASQVRTIINLPEALMIKLANETASSEISVRELEKRVRALTKSAKNEKNKSVKNPESSEAKDPNIKEIEELYRNRLKTKVTISPIKNKLGKIEIDYYDYDELLEILSRISEIDKD